MRFILLTGLVGLAAAVPMEAADVADAIKASNMTLEELDEMGRHFGDTTFSLEEQLKIAYSVHEQALANADPLVLQQFTSFSVALAAGDHDYPMPTVKDVITAPVELVKYLGSTAAHLSYAAGKFGYGVIKDPAVRIANDWTARGSDWTCKPIIFFYARGTLEKGNMVCRRNGALADINVC